jgi:5'-3' exonuclease
MGISRLESIIRNSDLNKTVKTNGIIKMALRDLPIIITNNRANQQIRTVVIDTSEFIYKSIIGGDHTSGILNFLEKMFRCQLMPIFVFDGKPPKEKNRIIEERKRIKERARERVESLKGEINKADEALNIVTGLHESGQSITTSINIITVSEDRIFNQKDNNTMPEICITVTDEFDCSCDKSHNETSQDNEDIVTNKNEYANYIDNMNITYERLLGLIGDDDNYTTSMSDDIRNGNPIHTENIIDRLRAKISNLYSETERMGKKMVGIQDVQYTDIKQLFNHFNIPYIHAGVEAEMICAALVKLGIADYCIGNDMDLFALGCPRIIRNINFRDDFVDVYYLDIILNNLNLSYIEFIDLCILLGSDYTGRLGGVKNYHILEYIHKYRTIESILENINDINSGLVGECTDDGMQRVVRIPESFNYNEARAIFLTEFTEEQIASLFHIPVIDIYQSCANKCLELRHNYSVYDKTIEFCQIKCDRLNNMLITKKINTIIWSNLFNDEKTDDFIMVKSKKTSPINILGRRTDIINDIRARGHHKNFSRVAFGSSPNHAMVMG